LHHDDSRTVLPVLPALPVLSVLPVLQTDFSIISLCDGTIPNSIADRLNEFSCISKEACARCEGKIEIRLTLHTPDKCFLQQLYGNIKVKHDLLFDRDNNL